MIKWLARSYKVYTKEEVLKPFLNRSYKNLFEMAGNYRNNGIGLKFWRKSWPEDCYYTLTRIELHDMRHGKAWGIKTWKGITQHEEEIRSPLKLGTWVYANPKNIKDIS